MITVQPLASVSHIMLRIYRKILTGIENRGMLNSTGVIDEPCSRTFWQFLPFYSFKQLNRGRDHPGKM